MKKEVRIEVQLPRRDSVLAGFEHRHHLNLNILRGRVTEKRAWYLLAVSGAARKVEAFVRLFRKRGLLVRAHALKTSVA